MLRDPKEGTTIARIGALKLGHDGRRLSTVQIRASSAAIRDAESEHDLRWIALKDFVRQIGVMIEDASEVRSWSGNAIVELRHEKIELVRVIPQDVVVVRFWQQIRIHGRVRDNGIGRELSSEARRNRGKKVLGFRTLAKPRVVLVVFVIVLIVKINSVEVHVAHDGHQLVHHVIFLAKAVFPAIIDIACPAATHSSSTETQQDLFAGILPLLNQPWVGSIVANWRSGDIASSVALIFSWTPSVAHSEGDDDMGVMLPLIARGAGLPVSDVCDQAR